MKSLKFQISDIYGNQFFSNYKIIIFLNKHICFKRETMIDSFFWVFLHCVAIVVILYVRYIQTSYSFFSTALSYRLLEKLQQYIRRWNLDSIFEAFLMTLGLELQIVVGTILKVHRHFQLFFFFKKEQITFF